ncbi:unnamed protein product [Prorocentrum cordatum]|uniref:Uncharacterized protein n=1 Tax=Prorocentrum cordatum TaxID=2364126 RepID=A0ABN9WKV8_9DINO|nr:unnamed protein product [Polarella glacialis]
MQASAQAVLFLLFCCAAQPGSSVSVSERWPWSKKKNAQPAAAEAPMQKQYLAPGPAPAEDVLSELTQAGCYMRMPSGCPKAPMRTELWRHDAWAEKEGLDQEGCKSRKAVWDKYCDATDAQMAFVANQTHSPPLSALQISAGWTWPWSKRKAAPAAAEEKPAEAKAAETEAAVLAVDTESKVKSPTKPGWGRTCGCLPGAPRSPCRPRSGGTTRGRSSTASTRPGAYSAGPCGTASAARRTR